MQNISNFSEKSLSNIKAAVAAIKEYGSLRSASEALGIAKSTLQDRVAKGKELFGNNGEVRVCAAPLELPHIPTGAVDTKVLIDHLAASYELKAAKAKSTRWMKIKAPEDAPIGIAIWGDPHLDNPGTNWSLLREHALICKETPGIYGLNIGDTTDNWVGRLKELYSRSEVSREQADTLVKWFLRDSGINWFLWLMGNHDLWNEGEALLRAHNVNKILMEDWGAQFQLVFPNGRACRIDARHDFKGHSMWNNLHAMTKAAAMEDPAHLYVSGHKHSWALHQEENASKDFVFWLARARGYKFLDDYALQLGHRSQEFGATILAIVDPTATRECNFVQCYADLEQGADVLTFLRKRAGV